MIAIIYKDNCPVCDSDEVSANVIIKGKAAVFTCWKCGCRYGSNGAILWAPGKEARG